MLVSMPLLALLISACGLLPSTTDVETINDIVSSTEGVSTLETALAQEGLDSALNVPDASYTVFAPSDAAFGSFLEANAIEASDLLALDDLRDILLFHVVDGEFMAADIVAAGSGTLATLQGGEISYSVGEGVVLTDAVGRNVNVVATDITAANGVIHLIDDVLLPFGTIADIAALTPGTSILLQAVEQAGLGAALQDLTAEYTVFAPTNTAFTEFLNVNSLTPEQLLASPNLASILLYHVVDAELFAADVIALAPTTATTLEGGTIDVAVVDGNVQLTDENGVTMTVVATDINALNGVIHLIDYVLTPAADEE